jgi:hypothetical protein
MGEMLRKRGSTLACKLFLYYLPLYITVILILTYKFM